MVGYATEYFKVSDSAEATYKKTIQLNTEDLPVLEDMLMRMRFQPEHKEAAARLVAAIMLAQGDDDRR